MPEDSPSQLGPYMLLAPIGSGGMGEVWKARDTRLNRIVAIKRLKGQHSSRFEQEARAIAALNHSNICVLYDIGPDYLVMEYIEGKPVPGKLPPDEAIGFANLFASALEEAHGRGILHRDVKPGIILVTAKGSIKLLDFGLAKLLTEDDCDATRTTDGTVLGTAAYMSPEQAQGKPLDERSDVFSFGAVLYEMLSGTRAFSGDSLLDTLNAVVRDEPAPLQSPAADIVKRCMAKQAARRFQSIAEVRAALEEVSLKQVEHQPSIAVLPFANMSGDKEQEYFSDGLAEEIINALTHVPGLKVIARTSAFAFKGKNEDIRRIAEALGVVNILEGSVRKAGNRIRVMAQLIAAADGSHLWSERYDRDLTDIFAVQDEISAAIAKAWRSRWRLSSKSTALELHTPKLPAYEAYLRARHYQWRTTPESLARSKECYEQAIALDPKFALAYVGFGDYFLFLAAAGLQPARQAMPLVRQNAQKAVEFDPSLPEAHGMLGIVAGTFDHDWPEVARRFQLAMARPPVPPLVHVWYGFFYLMQVSQPEQAVEQQQGALREDPLNALYRMCLSVSLTAAGRPADAEREVRQVLEVDPAFLYACIAAGALCAMRGNTTDALAFAERAHALGPWNSLAAGLLAAVLERTGDAGRSKVLLETLRSGDEYGASIGIALFHACLGQIDSALEWTEKRARRASPGAALIYLFLDNRVLRSSPRWPALAKALNLPEEQT